MSQTAEKAHFSIAEVLKNLVALMLFAVLTGWGLRTALVRPGKTGWVAMVFFGTLSVLTLLNIIRLCGLEDEVVVDPKSRRPIRNALVQAGMLVVTFFSESPIISSRNF